MNYWKQLLGRLALSTASLTVIAGLGGFLGAICGAIVELMLQAVLGLALAPFLVIPGFLFLGISLSLAWGIAVLYQHRTV